MQALRRSVVSKEERHADALRKVPDAVLEQAEGNEEATMSKSINLLGHVSRIESANEFTDKRQRAYITIKDADSFHYGTIRVVNDQGLVIDDEVLLSMTAVPKVARF